MPEGKHLPSVSMKYVNVVIDHNSRHTDTYYTYSTEEDLRRGSLVQVPFNRGNKLKMGYVFETEVQPDCDPSKVKAVAVMDKCESFSACGGPVFAETRSALYDLPERPMAVNYVYGLGGRDVTIETFETIYDALDQMATSGQTGEVYRHIGVRDLEDQR